MPFERPAGLWQLFAVKHEAQNNALVSKQVPQVEQFESMSNELVAGAFSLATRDVDFAMLDQARVHTVGLMGSNADVWRALCQVEIERTALKPSDLSEGLWLWSPSVAASTESAPDHHRDPHLTDCIDSSSESDEDAGECTFYLFIWAGGSVEKEAMHPPFNLSVRLLMELTDTLLVCANAQDARALDEDKKPLRSGAGVCQFFRVGQETAAKTAVNVGAAQVIEINVSPEVLKHRSGGMTMAGLSMRWHCAPQGACLQETFEMSGPKTRRVICSLDPANGLEDTALFDGKRVVLSKDWELKCQCAFDAAVGFMEDEMQRPSMTQPSKAGLDKTFKALHGKLKNSALAKTIAALLPRLERDRFCDEVDAWSKMLRAQLDEQTNTQRKGKHPQPMQQEDVDAVVAALREDPLKDAVDEALCYAASASQGRQVPVGTFARADAGRQRRYPDKRALESLEAVQKCVLRFLADLPPAQGLAHEVLAELGCDGPSLQFEVLRAAAAAELLISSNAPDAWPDCRDSYMGNLMPTICAVGVEKYAAQHPQLLAFCATATWVEWLFRPGWQPNSSRFLNLVNDGARRTSWQRFVDAYQFSPEEASWCWHTVAERVMQAHAVRALGLFFSNAISRSLPDIASPSVPNAEAAVRSALSELEGIKSAAFCRLVTAIEARNKRVQAGSTSTSSLVTIHNVIITSRKDKSRRDKRASSKRGPVSKSQAHCHVEDSMNGFTHSLTYLALQSSGGESSELTLAATQLYYDKDEWTDAMLVLQSSLDTRPAQSIRVVSAKNNTDAGTHVYVYPAGAKIDPKHERLSHSMLAGAASFEPSTRMLALLFPGATGGAATLGLYVFNVSYEKLSECRTIESGHMPRPLFAWSGDLPILKGGMPTLLLPRTANVGQGSLDAGQDKFALLMTDDRVRLFNCSTSSYEPDVLEADSAETQWLVTPNSAALLALRHAGDAVGWQMHAYALEECKPAQPLFDALGCVPLPTALQFLPEGTCFTTVSIQGRPFLVAAATCAAGPRILAAPLDVSSVRLANTLESSGEPDGHRCSVPWCNTLLNYFHHVCERFPMDDSIGLAMLKRGSKAAGADVCRTVKLVMCTDTSEDAERMRDYVADILGEVLDDATQKPHGKLIRLQPCASGQDADESSSGANDAKPFGAWLRRAMCLTPLQISRCTGNALEPMHDGESRPFDADDSGTDVMRLSQRLRLGLYECVLKAHLGPVVVICAIGQQSVGKSYQLNHLGGVFLDVAGGRCTDGVWLTVRPFTDEAGVSKLLVVLDCEGIGSQERTETDDMLHCLFAAAVSSFTMLKTQTAFTRELVETLKRLNKGAQKVQSIAGSGERSVIFQGSVMFCLKDVQRGAMKATVHEFKIKLGNLVQQQQNFVTTMYCNEVAVAAFPPLSRSFYKTLDEKCVGILRQPECPGYADGPTALQVMKLMLVKLALKDWTPIDRQRIASQVAELRAAMHAASHFGCRGIVRDGFLIADEGPLLAPEKDSQYVYVSIVVRLPRRGDLAQRVQAIANSPIVSAARVAATTSDTAAAIDESSVLETEKAAGEPSAGGDAAQGADGDESSFHDASSIDSSDATSSDQSLPGALFSKSDAALSYVDVALELDLSDHKLRMGHLESADNDRDGPALQRVSADSVAADFERLKALLAAVLQLDRPDKDPEENRSLHSALKSLMQALVRRREDRCNAWLKAAVAEFGDCSEASELHNALAVHLRRLEAACTLCGAPCAHCHLPCSELGAHNEHACDTDHRCHEVCVYCLDEGAAPESAERCKDKAGHAGQHMCGARQHACGKPCKHAGALHCRGTCRKLPLHDGECDCESGTHLCGAPCGLPGCHGKCILPYGTEHERHECAEASCPERCPLCEGKCGEGHFHSVLSPSAPHLCGREHACIDPATRKQRLCSSEGICAIGSEVHKIERRVFRGRADEFEYDHHAQQVVNKDVCIKMVPAGKMAHEGPCCCARAREDHFCAEQCPGCRYLCTKHVGHAGRHAMQHGNIVDKVFFSNREVFSLEDRKYARGDTGVAETCDSFCSRCGRGHVHFLSCKGRERCGGGLNDGLRHVTDPSVETHPAQRHAMHGVDECTHDYYWKQANVEDPCAAEEKEAFRLCGSTCASAEHETGDDTDAAAHCLLKMWHEPLNPNSSPEDHMPAGQPGGYVSEDGCLFPCTHQTGSGVHTIFLIDKSKSMEADCVRPESADIRKHSRFCAELDSAQGVVYEAAFKYICERRVRGHRDLCTFISFDDAATVHFFARPVTQPWALLDEMMKVKPKFGTRFVRALDTAFENLQAWRETGEPSAVQRLKPVIIMLTDSRDINRQAVPHLLMHMSGEADLPEPQRVSAHMFGFGVAVDESYMRRLAAAGGGSFMACRTGTDIDRHHLVKAFGRLAAKPALKVSLLEAVRRA